MAAELTHLVKEEFDPLLIRALLIHNAKYPANNSMSMTDKVTQMGFGAPSSVQEMLYNSEDEITLILRDTLEKEVLSRCSIFHFLKVWWIKMEISLVRL